MTQHLLLRTSDLVTQIDPGSGYLTIKPDINPNTRDINPYIPDIYIYTPDIYIYTPNIYIYTPDINPYTPDIYIYTPDIYVYTPDTWPLVTANIYTLVYISLLTNFARPGGIEF